MSAPPPNSAADIDLFIARWSGGDGGQERANYALFLSELCDVLGAPRPDQASHNTLANAYVFERAVTFREPDGTTANGRIDLYKRGCFVLEAKQSRRPGGAKAVPAQGDLLMAEEVEATPRGKRTASRGWDVLMMSARRQAEDYAKALPVSEGWPPFLIVCDVGHCFEIYADFSGQGKNYAQFPDRQGFRIYLEDLRDEKIRERLRLIWLDPHKLDPTKIAAKATRAIAERLAKVSKHLEELRDKDGRPLYDPEAVALFLMRCLFTMFAEDVELLPKGSFRDLLQKCADNPDLFPRLVGQLWEAMDTGGFSYALERDVKKFNGYLFKDRTALALPREEIGELYEAAKANWKEVEPAIFGTLLEQALDPAERRKLGAHYTPRAYVERLVVATVLEPLKADWANVQAAAETKRAEGDLKGARAIIQTFHDKLCATRILDPACGTGNFLYVSLELMKRIEGEVLEALASLSEQGRFEGYEVKSIDPHQFLGLEVNPRAAAIAELVLWIGFLQWHFRTRGGVPPEPILKDFKTIKVMDAVLAWDAKDLARDENGKPVTRTDAEGRLVEVYRYKNPRQPEWPEAEFIVGNPPFIGKGEFMRAALGDSYVAALAAVYPQMNMSADYVMFWWNKAGSLLTRKPSSLQRFGFVTTNSITQFFNRRVIDRHLHAKMPISIIMAIPDHPWTKATPDAASVRIAMTVGKAGSKDGVLRCVVAEEDLDTDTPAIKLTEYRGPINSDLSVGVDVTSAIPLQANEGLASMGPALGGRGFVVSSSEAVALGASRKAAWLKRLTTGKDITGRHRNRYVIDLRDIETEEALRQSLPKLYQHLRATVHPARASNNDPRLRTYWWRFRRSNEMYFNATSGLDRFIATVETTKHRTFVFVGGDEIVEHGVIGFGLDDAWFLGVLSCRIHVSWTLANGGTLEDRPRYNKEVCFDPFPFPDAPEEQKSRIRAVAEELDALRKQVQAEHPELTLTQIYNVLEKLRGGETLTAAEDDIKTKGLVLIIKELHDRLDALVAEAYRWPADLSDEEILERLVALNAERAAEEKRGLVRWLRPDYQRARAGIAVEAAATEEEQLEAELVPLEEKAQKPSFPSGDVERTAVVFAALMAASGALDAQTIAKTFKQGAKIEPAIARVLASLARLGHVHTADGRSFALRRSA